MDAVKGPACKKIYLGWSRSAADGVIQEKIVQFIGAYGVLCFLGYLAGWHRGAEVPVENRGIYKYP